MRAIQPLTRQHALSSWEAFLPKLVSYASDRNHVQEGHCKLSRLGASLRFRTLLENEIIEKILEEHPFGEAETDPLTPRSTSRANSTRPPQKQFPIRQNEWRAPAADRWPLQPAHAHRGQGQVCRRKNRRRLHGRAFTQAHRQGKGPLPSGPGQGPQHRGGPDLRTDQHPAVHLQSVSPDRLRRTANLEGVVAPQVSKNGNLEI